MVLWVGVDDTDSLRGMCTTFLATDPLNGVSAMPEFTDVTPAPTTTPSATISKSE